ncbi:MAG: XRE family transcriptional regulator [Microcystis sp. M53603_WE2]|jgi:ribosome-binding protein aMBF1 (putative translation factor)|uniref:helix-turn-helix domain-containing protein n=1 Tax=unclassified Microcystis TaxID=2643300 RepID=UPI0022BC8F7B|nr:MULTISPECIES: XRE family transcriptional regulator [unclassified Microcystis]MCZ8025571.1 XRE family transcriptional regulator [Microcystis sp. LE19-10.1B]MCZ8365241.1 XRE family transcriptional regulator [Microcystis sp. LE19-251.1A]MDJ0537182.1 XRE family transcriptional regulator [Microcystis sp. M53603_WE2]MDJ0606313.1 XRE family transcriptional regulator [Microcystis sp. M53602_WE12]
MPKTTDALKIIHQIIADDPTIQEQIALESINAEIAQLIYDSRTKAGLTQQQLADLIHVEKSVIEDLEDADYQDNPLIMLQKIATALNQKVKMSLVS